MVRVVERLHHPAAAADAAAADEAAAAGAAQAGAAEAAAAQATKAAAAVLAAAGPAVAARRQHPDHGRRDASGEQTPHAMTRRLTPDLSR